MQLLILIFLAENKHIINTYMHTYINYFVKSLQLLKNFFLGMGLYSLYEVGTMRCLFFPDGEWGISEVLLD